MEILISAGEASGDLYAAGLAEAIRRRRPGVHFFGCAGPRMRAAGVEAVVDASALSVVGLVEVIRHIPAIHREFRKLIRAASGRRPALAILTDSPDFHLRAARKLKRLGVPVLYLVAPQAWAWRKGRVRTLRGNIASLLCIFPFEEAFFRQHGVNAHYIGHPLTRIVRARWSRGEFFARHGLDAAVPMVVLLPGSRTGERARHLPVVLEAVDRLVSGRRLQFVLAVPEGTRSLFLERFAGRCIETIQGDTWDAIAHAELALAASGTVTVEAALLGTPMVTYYRVNRLSWLLGRPLVDVPYYTMVNLVAGRRVVPELIQNEMTAERIASEAARLLDDPRVAAKMRTELGEVARLLATGSDPMEMAADLVIQALSGRPDKEHAHVAS